MGLKLILTDDMLKEAGYNDDQIKNKTLRWKLIGIVKSYYFFPRRIEWDDKISNIIIILDKVRKKENIDEYPDDYDYTDSVIRGRPDGVLEKLDLSFDKEDITIASELVHYAIKEENIKMTYYKKVNKAYELVKILEGVYLSRMFDVLSYRIHFEVKELMENKFFQVKIRVDVIPEDQLDLLYFEIEKEIEKVEIEKEIEKPPEKGIYDKVEEGVATLSLEEQKNNIRIRKIKWKKKWKNEEKDKLMNEWRNKLKDEGESKI